MSSEITSAAREVMSLYPRIFFACHERHVRDPKTKQLVSDHQANILQHLDEIHAISTSALAGHMDVTISTMSLAVSRLAKLGYVRRKRDSADTRRVMLRLTRAGARVRDAQSVLAPHRVAELVATLSKSDRAKAIDGMRLLADAANKIGKSRIKSRANETSQSLP